MSDGISVSFTILGDELFAEYIEDVGQRAMNMSPVLHHIVEKWLVWTEEQFATEGKRSGSPWEQLARDTVLRRGSSHPILIVNADLLLEMTDPASFHVSDEGIELRTSDKVDEYGFYHQHGTSRMPARPIFDFTERDIDVMYDDLQDFLVGGILP